MRCTSCGKIIIKATKFRCPSCGKEIVRCEKCRKLRIKYKCECGFVGP